MRLPYAGAAAAAIISSDAGCERGDATTATTRVYFGVMMLLVAPFVLIALLWFCHALAFGMFRFFGY